MLNYNISCVFQGLVVSAEPVNYSQHNVQVCTHIAGVG